MKKPSIHPKPLLESLHSTTDYHRITPEMIRNREREISWVSINKWTWVGMRTKA
jgi:hypothetical protein